jgi:hypothetical protein
MPRKGRDKDPDVAAKRAEWNKKQQRNWLAISTNSRFLVVPGSDHLSLLSKKEHAAAADSPIHRRIPITSIRDTPVRRIRGYFMAIVNTI